MTRPFRAGQKARTGPVHTRKVELGLEALRLSREGHNLDEIAEMLGGGPGTRFTEYEVHELIKGALAKKAKPILDEVRDQELDRLDRLYNMSMKIAMKQGADRVAALNASINIMKRRAELLGLDAPKKVDLHDNRSRDLPTSSIEAFVDGLVQAVGADRPEGSNTTH